MKSEKNTSAKIFSVSPNENIPASRTISLKSRIQNTCSHILKRLFEPLSPKSPLLFLESTLPKRDFSNYHNSRSLSKKIINDSIKDHAIEDSKSSIINLPKLPFGKHCSYNEERDFVRTHFIKNTNEASFSA